ncbi:MAG: hypothetical protein H8E94_08930 [Alphaproteobacteria bacterium]|nr:hypothetical protein [Alphaproteobacteria bacterium]
MGELEPPILDDKHPLNGTFDKVAVPFFAFSQGLFRRIAFAFVVNIDQIAKFIGAVFNELIDHGFVWRA